MQERDRLFESSWGIYKDNGTPPEKVAPINFREAQNLDTPLTYEALKALYGGDTDPADPQAMLRGVISESRSRFSPTKAQREDYPPSLGSKTFF